MPNLIALEWDDSEARVAVADVRRGSVVLEQAFAVALPKDKTSPDASGATGTISVSGAHDLGAIGRRISDALTARGVRRVKTVVGVGRANIELKNLSLPPAPPEELPEMVRFQAEREFNTLTDEWPLDFIPLPSESDGTLTVLAAAISPELVAEIQITCENANLTPQRLVLRPCAAASLLSRAKPIAGGNLRLLVDLLTEEADLTVLAGDSPVFMRTARLPAETAHSDPLRTILPEIRRTIAAVQARFQGRQVEQVFLCGEESSQGSMARQIGRELNLATEVFNPLQHCTLAPELSRAMPDHPGRFAPLIGMLLDDAAGDSNTIDFLNPRKKPEPKSRRREIIIAAASAAVILLLGGGWIGYQLYGMDSDIDAATQRATQLQQQADKLKDVRAKADTIDHWLAGEVNWLDEIASLASKAPKAQDLMFTNLQIRNQDSRSGGSHLEMDLDCLVRSRQVIEQLYQVMDDDHHDVLPGGTKQTDEKKLKNYPLGLSFRIELKPTSTTSSSSTKTSAATNAQKSAQKSDQKPAADKSPTEKSPPPSTTDASAAQQPSSDKPAATDQSKPADSSAPATAPKAEATPQ